MKLPRNENVGGDEMGQRPDADAKKVFGFVQEKGPFPTTFMPLLYPGPSTQPNRISRLI